jgi:DNA-directed RNA polymerase I, II, and III subunit RPABC2
VTTSACAHAYAVSFTNQVSEGIDFDEEQEPEILDNDQDEAGGAEDPEAQDPDDNIVVSGDASAAATAKGKEKNTVESEKKKKVPNEDRTTTPYMTKYERARVLGTRALQIRCVWGNAGDEMRG